MAILHSLSSPFSFFTFVPAHFSPSHPLCFLLQTPLHSPLPASCWMNDSVSVSLSVSVIDQTPAAAVTSWKDKPSSEQQYSYWSSPLLALILAASENPEAVTYCHGNRSARGAGWVGAHEGLYCWSCRWEVFGWSDTSIKQSGGVAWKTW